MSKSASKLCLGGAFNPIHHAHLLCARAAAEALEIQTIVLIPSQTSPHKPPQGQLAGPADRLEMCRRAVAGLGGWEVDDRELRRPGPTYTIDTVRELRREGWINIPWLLGADQVLALPKWRQPHDLLTEAHLVPMARPGWKLDWTRLPPEFAILAGRLVTVPALDISATEIRRRVAQRLPIDFLTPLAVCQYIEERRLYQSRPTE